jgi:hypothetical protein
MGGSGSRGWSPTPPRDPCDTLAFRSQLNSPQPALIAQLAIGTVLTVQLAPPPQSAVHALHGNQAVGSITGSSLAGLINCLRNGYAFEAKVVAIAGGLCTVDVRPV